MTAATVPPKPKRCGNCNRAAIPQGRPRYWKSWSVSGKLHLVYSTRVDGLAYTGCGYQWSWAIKTLDRPDYLFPGHAPLRIDALKT